MKILKKYEADFAIDYQALNISALLLVLIVAAHWIACLIALICKYDDSSPHLNVYLPDLHVTNEQESTFKAYFYCFKWSLMWITTGYAEGQDEGIESSLLRGTTAMLLIIGALANAAIIGGVMTIVDEMNEASREFYSNLNTLNVYLKSEDVGESHHALANEDMDGVEFSRRLRRFYIYKFTNVKQYVALGNILQNVSMDMRRSWRRPCTATSAGAGEPIPGRHDRAPRREHARRGVRARGFRTPWTSPARTCTLPSRALSSRRCASRAEPSISTAKGGESLGWRWCTKTDNRAGLLRVA